MNIDRMLMSGTLQERLDRAERRCRFWNRIDRIAAVVTWTLVAAAGGAAVLLWIAWFCAGGP